MRCRDLLLLLAGVALTALAHVRAPLAALAWVAPVPFLMLLRSRPGWHARAAVVLALLVAWSLALGKILTDPMPAALALAFGVPIALLRAPAFLLWDALLRRQRPLLAVAAFGVTSALAE